MGKILAIKGHPTRGKEVIALLEMLGGKNHSNIGNDDDYFYYINDKNNIEFGWTMWDNNPLYTFFTLEEFLNKYPFKVNDKVFDKADGCSGVVCEMKWDEDVSDMKYCVAFGNGIDFGWFAKDSIEFCKENKNLEETQTKRDIDKSEFVIKHMILPNKVDDNLEYEIIDGYEFDKIDNNKIILKPIKSKYPKTYEECCEVLFNDKSYAEYIFIPAKVCISYHRGDFITELPFEIKPYETTIRRFYKLLICRDAYWKIAGEQMGLGKSWEPTSDPVYGITRTCNLICTSNRSGNSQLLEFPTEEMRDAFYENFKKEIEQCKELL